MFRISALIAILIMLSIAVLSANASDKHYPETIALPNGFHPEGIALGGHHSAYVGSLANGAIYQVNLLSGKGELLVDGNPGRIAVGLAFDNRSSHLFVAGGVNGNITVYDTENGEIEAEYLLDENFSGFVNDGIITKRAAYFTDSFQAVLYKIALNRSGKLLHESMLETIPLSGDISFTPGQFNANGIEASKNGKTLYIVNSFTGKLFSLNPKTGMTTEIPISGGDLLNGDGLVLHNKTLYVIQNFTNQITVVELSGDATEGTISNILSHPEFRIPTTAIKFGSSLFVVNARFDVAPPPFLGNPASDPNTTFNLIKVGIQVDD